MPITELNHYFVRANDLEKTKDFYVRVLGFEVMDRPNFPFPGYWLGVNGKIQVHMGPHGIPNAGCTTWVPPDAATDQTGVIDHIAFPPT
jgi:catechol 2,3-dioxygenase-like lactoylglutathione lyase family enzyme